MKTISLFILLLASTIGVFSQTINRGPYLQSNLPTSVILMWRTTTATDSKVMIGTHPDSVTRIYSLGGSRTDHQIKLTGLNPYTKYYYIVGNSSTNFFSADSIHSFVTAPYRDWETDRKSTRLNSSH